jgi:hypothetical protein
MERRLLSASLECAGTGAWSRRSGPAHAIPTSRGIPGRDHLSRGGRALPISRRRRELSCSLCHGAGRKDAHTRPFPAIIPSFATQRYWGVEQKGFEPSTPSPNLSWELSAPLAEYSGGKSAGAQRRALIAGNSPRLSVSPRPGPACVLDPPEFVLTRANSQAQDWLHGRGRAMCGGGRRRRRTTHEKQILSKQS